MTETPRTWKMRQTSEPGVGWLVNGSMPEPFETVEVIEKAPVDAERQLIIDATDYAENAAPGVSPVDYVLDLLTLAEGEREGWRERAESVATIEVELSRLLEVLSGLACEHRISARKVPPRLGCEWRALCSCGWEAGGQYGSESAAKAYGEDHIEEARETAREAAYALLREHGRLGES